MKSEAIRCAIKLHTEPTSLARFSDPYRKLPRGITELLRLASSENALRTISQNNNLHETKLKEILINYIQLVLLRDENPSHRKLGLSQDSSPELRKLHYKLLINIFHPDKSKVDPCFSIMIQQAHKDLKASTTAPSSSLNKRNHLASMHMRSKPKRKKLLREHIKKPSFIVPAFILFALLVLLFLPNPKPLIVKKGNSLDSIAKN